MGGFRLTVALVVACAVAVLSQHEEGDTCLTKALERAGMTHAQAKRSEARLAVLGVTPNDVLQTPGRVLAAALNASREHSLAFKACLGRHSPACQDFEPCGNDGTCVWRQYLEGNVYACQCPVTRTGAFCESDIDDCASSPCRNGGTCIDGVNSFTCNCSAGYDGDQCQTQWLRRSHHNYLTGRLAELNSVLQQIESRTRRLEDLTSALTLVPGGCNQRTLGYNYQSRHWVWQQQETGELARMTFNKKLANTVLKLSYSSNIRTYGAASAARWWFMIDGRECSRPTPIDIAMYQGDAGNTHVPAVLTGICEATSTGGITAGNHSITVHIGELPQHGSTDALSGWATTSILEAQEMCPPF